MKNYLSLKKVCILFFIFSFSFLISFAQLPIDNKLIPSNVKENFAKKFPAAGAVVWIQPYPGFFETSFSIEKHLLWVWFSEAGDWISTDTKLMREEFPVNASAYLDSNTSPGIISSYNKSESSINVSYYAEGNEGENSFIYWFDIDGNFTRKEELFDR